MRPAAALLAYCALGGGAFAHANGDEASTTSSRRVDQALERSESLDAGIVLLAFHAKLIQPEVVERHGISVETD